MADLLWSVSRDLAVPRVARGARRLNSLFGGGNKDNNGDNSKVRDLSVTDASVCVCTESIFKFL